MDKRTFNAVYWLCVVIAASLMVLQEVRAQNNHGKDEPISPLPLTIRLNPDKVALGDKLFHDPRLSKNGKLSCASCHNISTVGILPDHKHSAPGANGKTEPINIPTVFNSGFNYTQFWNGRAGTLEEQIDGPLLNPNEMGTSWKHVLKTLKLDKDYRNRFYKLYRSPPTERAVKDAIATYERSLITPNAPIDKYLRGDQNALTDQQKYGYGLFKKYGCASCHQGQNIGGNMFQSFGIVGDYFEDRGNITKTDYGRYNVTGEEDDKFVFRVPSLRNVALTPPYFHDGSAKTLGEAVDIMARYQLGRNLTEEERAALITFLESLTGEMP